MSRPAVRVNTFVVEEENPHLDVISKIFIVLEANRLPLIGRGKIYLFITIVIHLLLNIFVMYFTIVGTKWMTFMMFSKITQYILCTILSLARCKWMLSYYFKLNSFDTEAACRPKVSTSSIRNMVQAGLTILLVIGIYTIFPATTMSKHRLAGQFIPLHILYILEVHYYGHLLSLLIPRLKLINYYIESSLTSAAPDSNLILKQFVYTKNYNHQNTQVRMRQLMDLYEVIVEAYDSLIDGIKWQLLVIIITSFISILGFLYIFSLFAIRSGEVLMDYAILQVGMIVILMAPLFAPCTFGDCVHSEVRKLRELLASKLYENKLDKSGRSVARALLAFTETRDLSFRLLRMLNIDISLPFKFSGLLVTYLIILLQFEKVINP